MHTLMERHWKWKNRC